MIWESFALICKEGFYFVERRLIISETGLAICQDCYDDIGSNARTGG